MAAVKILFIAFLACSLQVNTEAAKLGFRNEMNINNFGELQAQNKDLKGCVVNHIVGVIGAAKKAFQTQRVCLEDFLPQLEEIENKLIAELIEVHGDLVTLVGNIKQCKDRECLKEYGAQTLEIIAVIGGKVSAAVQESMGIVLESSPEAANCALAAGANFIGEFRGLRQKFMTCIKA